jgi:hypothetical protein
LHKILSLFRNKFVRIMFASALIIVAGSWYRAYEAGTYRVDQHGLSGIPVCIVFFSFIAALSAYSVSLYRLWKDNLLSAAEIRMFSYIMAALFSFMLPMLSNDIFSLLAYGDAANRGVDVYTDVRSLIISPYFDAVSYLWKTAPCVYGPVSLGTSRIACLFSSGHLMLAIAVYKVLVFLWALIFIEGIYRLRQRLGLSVRPLLFILLNPVFLIQGVAQMHCDLLAMALSACLLYFFYIGRWYWAFLFAGIAIAAKMNFLLVLGFLVPAVFLTGYTWRSSFYKVFVGLCITVISLAILYSPYYTSIRTFSVPLNFLFGQNPGKSLSEVLGDVIYFAPSVISGRHDELNSTIAKSSGVTDPQLVVWLAVKKACQLFAFIIGLAVFIKFCIGEKTTSQWMRICLRMLLIFLLFYSHVFYAWYIMLILPFVWYEEDELFMQWLFVLTCFSNVHDIMCSVNHGTPVYFIVLPLTLIGVLIFFWRFRNNFFRSLDRPPAQG